MLAVSRFKEPRNGTFSGKSHNLSNMKRTSVQWYVFFSFMKKLCFSVPNLTNNPIRYVKNLSFPAGKVADVESHVFCLRPNLVLKNGK